MGLGHDPQVEFHNRHNEEDWRITLADTGEESMTAHRIWQIRKYLQDDDMFLLTYGDGVGAIDIREAIEFHRKSGKICTLTGVRPPGRFGELEIGADQITVEGFNEKPQVEGGFINGGYMVCNREIFDYLSGDSGMMLEQEPMKNLVKDGQLSVYRSEGFWQCMDTFAEMGLLNKMWASGNAPWKIW
jgi:glucose-1-phosphate cytidylyltransferase